MADLRNFRITIEQPREIVTKNDRDLTIDHIVTYVYGVRNHSEVKAALTMPDKLKELRKLGLRITKPQMAKANLHIERI